MMMMMMMMMIIVRCLDTMRLFVEAEVFSPPSALPFLSLSLPLTMAANKCVAVGCDADEEA